MTESVQRVIRRRKGAFNLAAAVLTTCLLGGTSPVATAAEGHSRDYYNPGTSQADVEWFKNVHSYHLQPGIMEMRPGRYDAALQHFEFILNAYPNQPEVLNLLSELCVVRWKSPTCDADPWFQKAIAQNPSIARTYLVYGIHQLRKGQPAEAIVTLNRALEMEPDSVNAHYNLGLAYFEVKDYVKANAHAQASYRLGAKVPGLRDKLVKAGHWKPIPTPAN